MGSSSPQAARASPEFLAVFRQHAGPGGTLTFERFMELALFDPGVGYYRRDRARIGYGAGTDFYTASTSGPIFGELVATACASLLRAAGRDPGEHQFIEVGAEDDAGILRDVTHPFADHKTFRVGQPFAADGPCVVFSNELFDAQPCQRLVRRNQRWFEFGVRLVGDELREVELPLEDQAADAPDGYQLDRPLAAARLAEELARFPWQGLFVAFDYGKSWQQLAQETPGGTVRAYHRHTQSNDLLARPGEQDLTCHVCWDWLEDALRRNGFTHVAVERQESFFIRHAGDLIAEISAAEASRLSRRKLALLQLLHPAQMGQKFQVLHGLR
jgi:SAM-dependent MidA family methyltransferase